MSFGNVPSAGPFAYARAVSVPTASNTCEIWPPSPHLTASVVPGRAGSSPLRSHLLVSATPAMDLLEVLDAPHHGRTGRARHRPARSIGCSWSCAVATCCGRTFLCRSHHRRPAESRLLLVSPWAYHYGRRGLRRLSTERLNCILDEWGRKIRFLFGSAVGEYFLLYKTLWRMWFGFGVRC